MTMEPSARGFFRRRRLFFGLLTPVLFFPSAWLVMNRMDANGREFYETGKGIVDTLSGVAEAVRNRDLSGIERRYSPRFSGQLLGLNTSGLKNEKDGVRIYGFRSPGAAPNRDAALAEWRDYLAGYQTIDEAQMHIHKLEDWDPDGGFGASVRFELIGTRKGEAHAGIDRAYWRMRFDPSPGGMLIREASLIEGERSVGGDPQFTGVAHEAGVDFVNQFYPAFFTTPLKFKMLRYGPAGITAADVDNDGWYDLFIPDGVESRLFRNRHDGTFEDVTARAGLSGLDGVSVGVFADYDNDGFKDFFVSRTFKPNQLFHNRGDGTFEDVTARAGIGADCCTTVASWADYDNDGDLDLYVGRYLDPRTKIPESFYARNGEPNQLYRNNGDGTFKNVTEEAGVGEIGLCLGTVFGDYDDDGDLDLYVVNDFGRNTLYRNEGDGTFEDVSLAANALAYGAGMSASFGDYDNDGRLDIYVANIRSEDRWFGESPVVQRFLVNSWRQGIWKTDMPLYMEIIRQSGFRFREVFQQMGSGNTLLHNKGDGTFEDVTWAAGANPVGWFWGSGFADFDNDGWQDLYSANGWEYGQKNTDFELDFFNGVVSDHLKYKSGYFFDPKNYNGVSWHGWEHNRHLRNNGDGTFSEIGRAAGTDLITNSRGVAFADFWNRGVLDVAVAASTDRHALLRNEVGLKRNWLAIEVTGGAGRLPDGTNRDGVGTRVTVKAGGKSLMREVVLGDGYGSQNSLRLYFGLGDARNADEITVRWPRSGRKQTFRNVAADAMYRLNEGENALTRLEPMP
jgi:ASPIC/UnbV protein/VCBS repeat protein